MEITRMLMEYCLNAMWLAPVVAGSAWLMVKLAGLRPRGEHWVWLGALAVCVALPGIGIRPETLAAFAAQPSAVDSPGQEATLEPIRLESLPSSTFESARPAAEAASSTAWFERLVREVAIPPWVAGWFGWVYARVVGLGALRLLRDWRAASTLVREASPYAFTEADAALLRGLAETFRLSVPRVLRSERIRSPVVVGALRPRLLLPAGFATCSEAERRAALCHELAHLRRRDCLVHAGVQTLMLPLIWHPAAHFAARRIARSREMACDALAAAAMNPEAGELTYARCLLNLARKMVGRENEALGLGLFRTNRLEERVMRLTEVKCVATMRERLVRRVGGAAVAGVVLAAGALVHVAPVVAQESGSSTLATVSQRSPVPAVPPVAAAWASGLRAVVGFRNSI